MVTDEMVEAGLKAYWDGDPDNPWERVRAVLEAADEASKSVMLKELRQWMKEMRRQTALRGEW